MRWVIAFILLTNALFAQTPVSSIKQKAEVDVQLEMISGIRSQIAIQSSETKKLGSDWNDLEKGESISRRVMLQSKIADLNNLESRYKDESAILPLSEPALKAQLKGLGIFIKEFPSSTARIINPDEGTYKGYFQGPDKRPQTNRNIVSFPWIVGISTDETGKDVAGTAFHIKDGWFVTAKHVVDGWAQAKFQIYCLTPPKTVEEIQPDQIIPINMTTIHYHQNQDLAIFRLKSNQVFQAPKLNMDTSKYLVIPNGASIGVKRTHIIGYGGGSIFPIASLRDLIISSDGTLIKGLGNTWRGYSGAPLLDEDNAVMGIMILQSGEDRQNGSATVVPAEEKNAFTALSVRMLTGFSQLN